MRVQQVADNLIDQIMEEFRDNQPEIAKVLEEMNDDDVEDLKNSLNTIIVDALAEYEDSELMTSED